MISIIYDVGTEKKSFLLTHSFSDIFQLPQKNEDPLQTFQTYFEHC